MKTLRDLMTPHPVTVGPWTSVREALEMLELLPIRHLPVVEDGAVVGMLSDRDLRPWRQALWDTLRGDGTPVAEAALEAPVQRYMRTEVLYLDAGCTAADAVETLLGFRVGAVPITEEGRLVGIVSYTDLLRYLQDILRTTG